MNNKYKNIKNNQMFRYKVQKVAEYIVENRATVRDTAKVFGVSKSTIHNYVTKYLEDINPELHKKVQIVLKHHLSIRHLRGGEGTRLKHKKEVV